MFQIIKDNTKKNFIIKTSGKHVFFMHNVSGEFNFTITAEQVELYVFGLYTGSGKDSYKLQTLQRHKSANSKSAIIIAGVFDDNSKFAYDGLIHLHKKATKTDAVLESRNILLSENATVQAKPQLEIIPADVKCTHAATIAHINQEHLEMLMMRGLSESQARELLISGFINSIFLRMQNQAQTKEHKKTITELQSSIV